MHRTDRSPARPARDPRRRPADRTSDVESYRRDRLLVEAQLLARPC